MPAETVELGSESALYLVGKHSSASLQLEHPSVSRRHAALVRDANRGLLLIDLGSKAGTTLNGRPLPPLVGAKVRDGSVFVFGGSSRGYTLRVKQADALEALAAEHAKLTAQIEALEKEGQVKKSPTPPPPEKQNLTFFDFSNTCDTPNRFHIWHAPLQFFFLFSQPGPGIALRSAPRGAASRPHAYDRLRGESPFRD